MLEMNKEYTYKEICSVLGWKESSGNQKKKQIKEVEDSYEFYHPENKKTHKPKKSYIFTKQLKEPELQDRRKNNGAKNYFPDEDFEYLFRTVLNAGFNRNEYFQRGKLNEIYMTSSLIYKEFGLDIYSFFNRMFFLYKPEDKDMRYLFEDICMDAVKANTITRICKRMGYKRNSLPKGIMKQTNSKNKIMIPANELLPYYEEYMANYLRMYNYASEFEAVRGGDYSNIVELIQACFEEDFKVYGVKRYNLITIDSEVIDIDDFEYNPVKKAKLQREFRFIVLESIMKTVRKRCIEERAYKKQLNVEEKRLLLEYFKQMLRDDDVAGLQELSNPRYKEAIIEPYKKVDEAIKKMEEAVANKPAEE